MLKPRFCALLAGAAVAAIPMTALAREESNIRLFMEPVGPAGDDRGQLRSDLRPERARLRVEVTRLAPDLEHVVLGDGVEIARFTTTSAGRGEVDRDLFQTGQGTTPSFDPRGKRIAVNDGTSDVLEAWVYADPADDPARPRIKEQTTLAREAASEGTVEARYDALPSGGARFTLAMRGVAPGTYDVMVDGANVATVTPNPGGSARLDLRIQPGNGNGNAMSRGNGRGRAAHNVRGPLEVDPRSKEIEIVQAAVVQFAGPMRAQIPGLGVCGTSTATADLVADPMQTAGAGSVSLAVEESCDLHMTLALSDLAAGQYDLLVAGADAGDLTILDAGAGIGSATFVFDSTPDALAGELALPVGVESGATLAIQEQAPLGTDVVLTGTLP